MADELVYTSSPEGLRPGTSGFCVVAATASLVGTAVASRLEMLSGYSPLYSVGDPRAGQNPINYAHLRLDGGRSVLSRMSFAGADHTGRTNKLAHHIVLEPAERAAAGPAWMMRRPGLFRDSWQGSPTILPPKSVPGGDAPAGAADTWAQIAGDAGWAGVLAEASMRRRPVVVIYDAATPAQTLLAMVDEAICLLPPAKRWAVTFSTYATESAAAADVQWRFCIASTPAAESAARAAGTVIDLTQPLGQVPVSVFADAARSGRVAEEAVEPPETSAPATALRPLSLRREPLVERQPLTLGQTTEPAASVPAPNRRPLNLPKPTKRDMASYGRVWIAVSVAAALLVIGLVPAFLLLAPKNAELQAVAHTNVNHGQSSALNDEQAGGVFQTDQGAAADEDDNPHPTTKEIKEAADETDEERSADDSADSEAELAAALEVFSRWSAGIEGAESLDAELVNETGWKKHGVTDESGHYSVTFSKEVTVTSDYYNQHLPPEGRQYFERGKWVASVSLTLRLVDNVLYVTTDPSYADPTVYTIPTLGWTVKERELEKDITTFCGSLLKKCSMEVLDSALRSLVVTVSGKDSRWSVSLGGVTPIPFVEKDAEAIAPRNSSATKPGVTTRSAPTPATAPTTQQAGSSPPPTLPATAPATRTSDDRGASASRPTTEPASTKDTTPKGPVRGVQRAPPAADGETRNAVIARLSDDRLFEEPVADARRLEGFVNEDLSVPWQQEARPDGSVSWAAKVILTEEVLRRQQLPEEAWPHDLSDVTSDIVITASLDVFNRKLSIRTSRSKLLEGVNADRLARDVAGLTEKVAAWKHTHKNKEEVPPLPPAHMAVGRELAERILRLHACDVIDEALGTLRVEVHGEKGLLKVFDVELPEPAEKK